jgi:pimeloyl-ACP methyl ester carboxylesterase
MIRFRRCAAVAAVVVCGAILMMASVSNSSTLAFAAENSQSGAYAELPGVKLWFTDSGGVGVPIILLHSNSGTSLIWENQVRSFSAAGYRVITFDRGGWGKSVANAATGPQPGSIADDLDALADYLKLDRFHLVGVAGGGFAALDYAGWRPQRLRSLVVGASTGQVSDMADVIARVEIPEIRKQPTVYLEIGPSYRAVNLDGTKRWNEIEENSRQPGAANQPLRTPNTFAKIGGIPTPTLIIAADADLLAPPALMRIWAAHVKNHEWAVIPDAGHAVAWEQPDIFNERVLAFVKRY